jgi:hypothetical protein
MKALTDIFESYGGVNAKELVPLATLVKDVS